MAMKKFPEVSVDLDAPAQERWARPPQNIARMVHDLTDSVLELCRELLPEHLQPLLSKKIAFANLLADPACRLFMAPLHSECVGLSRATGIPASLLAVANCAYDFAQVVSSQHPSACSAAVLRDHHGRPVLLRYMDWSMPEDIADYTLVTHFISGGETAYRSLGFAGFLGVVTAMGPAWAVALNQAPAARVPKSLFGHPACYAMRMACDQSATFRELQTNIVGVNAFTPFLSLLCGTEPEEVSRIEKPLQGKSTLARAGKLKILGLANHYLHRDHRKWNMRTRWKEEEETYIFDTHERHAEVRCLAGEHNGFKKWPGLRNFMVDPMLNDSTVHLALMRPTTDTMRFRVFNNQPS
jgi:hypothetical protein